MRRRGLCITLLVLLAVQLAGSMALASVCPEPCPDDPPGTSCPPVCARCTSCAHTPVTMVRPSASGLPLVSAQEFVPQPGPVAASRRAADIFHVPLAG